MRAVGVVFQQLDDGKFIPICQFSYRADGSNNFNPRELRVRKADVICLCMVQFIQRAEYLEAVFRGGTENDKPCEFTDLMKKRLHQAMMDYCRGVKQQVLITELTGPLPLKKNKNGKIP